jgi:hypothetical protein
MARPIECSATASVMARVCKSTYVIAPDEWHYECSTGQRQIQSLYVVRRAPRVQCGAEQNVSRLNIRLFQHVGWLIRGAFEAMSWYCCV